MPSHLPLLLNPFLNAIFNNPQPSKSLLKDVYANISKGSEDGVILLVPDLNILLNYIDKETGIRYQDLCYSEEFLKDHIITTDEVKNARLFTTLSKKEVLIKKDVIFTGKGFKRSLRLKVLSSDYFHNFNDYFEKGRSFMIMCIEAPLCGTPEKHNVLEVIMPSNDAVERVMLHEIDENAMRPSVEEQTSATSVRSSSDNIKFEQILRTFPLIARTIGEKYEILFKKFNVRNSPDTDSLIEVFSETINLSTHIFQLLSPSHIDAIVDLSPNIDFNECLFNYVEFNLYDKIWHRLCELNDDFLAPHYEDMEFLSINQVNLPKQFKHNIQLQCLTEKRIFLAISELKKLDLSVTAESKARILIDTVSILSNIESTTVDADTLVGLLLMVVVHSKVRNLENHLFHLQNFSFHNTDLGLVGYSLSTFEGVLYYLKDTENINLLKSYSLANRKVASYVETKELISLKKLADNSKEEFDSSLKCRSTNGESLLTLAVQSNDYDTWKLLIDYEHIFTLEDILADKTTLDATLLNIALNSENFEIVNDIVDILLDSCTVEELIAYFNIKDVHNRTIGHYLFHYKELIPKVGKFINWLEKDLNGQTPLFSVCRSYDTPHYSEMIKTVFKVVNNWYINNRSTFDYEDHIDNRGNTLLHILSTNIDILLKYQRINLNEVNKKTYTPLMIYAKYNRLENIELILDDDRINILKPDKNNFTALDLSKNQRVSSLLERKVLEGKSMAVDGTRVGVVRVRLENSEWQVLIRGVKDGVDFKAYRSFTDFKNLIELIHIEFPNTFIPVEYVRKNLKAVLNIPSYNKLKLNKIVDRLNIFLGSLLLNRSVAEHELLWHFLSSAKDFAYPLLLERSQLKLINFKKAILEGSSKAEDDPTTKKQFMLQPENIGEINFFLKFSIKEINKLRSTYDKLLKVVNFIDTKHDELRQSIRAFSSESVLGVEELHYVRQLWNDSIKEIESEDDLCKMIMYLSLSTDEVVKKANRLVEEKIYRWWKLYGELIEINNSYKRFKYVELKKTSKNEDNENEGLVQVNEEGFRSLTNDTTFVVNKANDSPTKKQKPSFLTSFIESKRTKHEQKLLSLLHDVKNQLIKLSRDIKFDHETLAMEMNNFLIFKTKHLEFALQKYTKKQIKDLKFSIQMFERGLEDLRSVRG